jgi:4-nitrophenol 2-monooxygenase / 4-nitrocatechol 4-monooxygenase, oxygenase component
VIKLLTMQRVEYQADGPLTQLARDVLGLADVSGLAERMDEEKADYPSIRRRPEYIKEQDVAMSTDKR